MNAQSGISALVACMCFVLCTTGAQQADPKETYQALVKAHQNGQKEFNQAYGAAKTDDDRKRIAKELGPKSNPSYFAPQFLALIRTHPNDDIVFDAFWWLLAYLRDSAETDQAINLLIRHRINDEKLSQACRSLTTYPSSYGPRLLQAAIDKSPHRTVQGHARYALATSLARGAERLANASPEDRAPYEKQAEQLLQEVIDKYGDLQYFDSTLGKLADKMLFTQRHLAIGKTVPEVEGEDLDGMQLKLSQFRGKVILLSFWGTW